MLAEKFAVGEVADEAEVGSEEIVVGECGKGSPAHVVEDLVFEGAVELVDDEKFEADGSAVAVGVANLGDAATDLGVDAEFFVEFTGEGGFRGFAGLDFAAGKLPLETHGLVWLALADKDFRGREAGAEDERGYDETERPGGSVIQVRLEFADLVFHGPSRGVGYGSLWLNTISDSTSRVVYWFRRDSRVKGFTQYGLAKILIEIRLELARLEEAVPCLWA